MSTRRLLAHAEFRRYLAGQTLSLLGDRAMWMACGIWVKTLTGSNAAAGLTFLFFGLPALAAPLAGLLVDRLRRRTLLLAANLAGVLILAPLLLVHHRTDVWLIYTVMLLYGTLSVVIEPAQSALLAGLLPADQLASANGLLRTIQESLRVLAPLAGAGLFAALGGHAVAVLDMATFAAAAGFVAAMRYREPRPHPAAEQAGDQRSLTAVIRRFSRDVAAGFAFIAASTVLRRTTVACAIATLVIGFSETTGYAIVSDGLHRRPEFLSVIQVAMGTGAILGGLSAATLVRRLGEVRVAAAGLVVFAAGAAVTTVASVPAVLAGMLISGTGMPVIVVAIITLLQRSAPAHLQGRVFSGFEMATTGPQMVGVTLGAGLIAIFDYRLVLAVEAVVLVAAALLLSRAGTATQPATGPVTPAESLATAEASGRS